MACARPYRKALPRTTIEGCKTERGPFSSELLPAAQFAQHSVRNVSRKLVQIRKKHLSEEGA